MDKKYEYLASWIDFANQNTSRNGTSIVLMVIARILLEMFAEFREWRTGMKQREE